MAGGEQRRNSGGCSRLHPTGTAAGPPARSAAAREHVVAESGLEALLAAVQGVVGELRVWERHNVVPCQQEAFSQIVQRLSVAAHEAARAPTALNARAHAAPDVPSNHIPAQTVTRDERPPVATSPEATSATAVLDEELSRLELRERRHEHRLWILRRFSLLGLRAQCQPLSHS